MLAITLHQRRNDDRLIWLNHVCLWCTTVGAKDDSERATAAWKRSIAMASPSRGLPYVKQLQETHTSVLDVESKVQVCRCCWT